MNQLDFSLPEAIVLRDKGINQVADNNEHFLEVARFHARDQARRRGAITADDVRKVCPLDPLHPNAYGAIFKSGEWEWTGQYRRSHAVSRHGGMQRVWRLRDR